MPTFEGFGSWVKIGRQRREEFQVKTDIIEKTTSTVCYIISETDREFSVHWQAPINAPDICINVFVDGKYIDDSLSGADNDYRSGIFRGVQAEGNSIALFSFSAPNPSTSIDVENGNTGYKATTSIPEAPDGPNPVSSCMLAREVGTIHIEMFEVEISEEEVSDSEEGVEDIWKRCTELKSDPLPEHKKLVLTHTVGSHKTIALTQKPEKCFYTSSPGKPVVSFTFQYRGKDYLEAVGIIPKPVRGSRSSARLLKTASGVQGDELKREYNDEGQVQNLNSNASRGNAEVFNVKKEKTPFPARVLGPTTEEREEELSIAREREELAKRKRELEVKERFLEERQKRFKSGDLEDRKPGWHGANALQDLKVLDDGAIDLTDD